MTYFFSFLKNITKRGNIGVFVFLLLNIGIIIAVFSRGFTYIPGIYWGIGAYIISLAIAFSSMGEWILRVQHGCLPIRDKAILLRLQPLFDEVLAVARQIAPSISQKVRLFINHDPVPNAFATGRKTICITNGFLDYDDDAIKAVFAHELGHLAHKDTDLIVMVSIGNFIVTTVFIVFRMLAWLIAFFAGIIIKDADVVIQRILIDFFLGSIMWAWTKLGTLLLMYSSRKNEYMADYFAHRCGYGKKLATVLSNIQCHDDAMSLWANLTASHPQMDERIYHLLTL